MINYCQLGLLPFLRQSVILYIFGNTKMSLFFSWLRNFGLRNGEKMLCTKDLFFSLHKGRSQKDSVQICRGGFKNVKVFLRQLEKHKGHVEANPPPQKNVFFSHDIYHIEQRESRKYTYH